MPNPPIVGRIDVHQHLWPAELLEALRARRSGPRLDGWTLHLPGEPPFPVTPQDHDLDACLAREAGTGLALVSLSSPLGIEDLHPDDAAPLLDAWHVGAARLPAPFGAWAAVSRLDPDPGALKDRLTGGFVGLQVPATWLATPARLEEFAPVLAVCEAASAPVLVHPGPVAATDERESLPGWWPAVVDYPAQLQAAWWAWHAAGRSLLPTLRIGFVAGAGLAAGHHERLRARGGSVGRVDADVFVETSSYGPQGLDVLVRALGIDVVVAGSDRPYAEPADLAAPPFNLGTAAANAVDVVNPHRFLYGITGGAS
ncbi:amidohydrolase family protein [Spongisporangium articulatum]|uniref:Amidohydrolase family protein n=1 Tax=Spongisporangium articulatum TaxID=3362603 RepID=A0ABW8AJ83_9ACTN